MTSDFTIYFESNEEMLEAVKKLGNVKINEEPLFGCIDIRQNSLFVMSDYSKEITSESYFDSTTAVSMQPNEQLVFVALKNGKHDGSGTAWTSCDSSQFSALDGKHVKALHHYILDRFPSKN